MTPMTFEEFFGIKVYVKYLIKRKKIIAYAWHRKEKKALDHLKKIKQYHGLDGKIIESKEFDGWLDIIFFSGNEEVPLSPIWVYYNNQGEFSEENREPLNSKRYSATGGMLADFNGDGNIDVFINEWYGGYSFLAFGPDFEKITEVPNKVDHHALFWEIYNIYKREPYEGYISPVFEVTKEVNAGKIIWIHSCPGNSWIKMYIRTGYTSFPGETWTEWIPVKGKR